MRVIYATGQPRYFEFAVAGTREAVPAGATLFAICTAERTQENLDEDLFDAISDEEYYTFRALVNEAEQLERQSRQPHLPAPKLSLKRLLNWLRGDKGTKPAMSGGRGHGSVPPAVAGG